MSAAEDAVLVMRKKSSTLLKDKKRLREKRRSTGKVDFSADDYACDDATVLNTNLNELHIDRTSSEQQQQPPPPPPPSNFQSSSDSQASPLDLSFNSNPPYCQGHQSCCLADENISKCEETDEEVMPGLSKPSCSNSSPVSSPSTRTIQLRISRHPFACLLENEILRNETTASKITSNVQTTRCLNTPPFSNAPFNSGPLSASNPAPEIVQPSCSTEQVTCLVDERASEVDNNLNPEPENLVCATCGCYIQTQEHLLSTVEELKWIIEEQNDRINEKEEDMKYLKNQMMLLINKLEEMKQENQHLMDENEILMKHFGGKDS